MPDFDVNAILDEIAETPEEKEAAERYKAGERPTEEPQQEESAPPEVNADEDADAEAEAEEVEQPRAAPEKPKKRTIRDQLTEEREARKANERRVAELAAEIEKLRNPPKQPEAPKIPTEDEDLVGHLKARLAMLEGATGAMARQTIEQSQNNAITSAWHAEVSSYSQQNPDFRPALDWLANQRDAELSAMGYNEQQRQEIITREAWSEWHRAQKEGVRLTERLYAFAKARGYQTPSPKPQIDDARRISSAQRETKRLTSGESALSGPLTVKELIDIPDDKFSDLFRKSGGDLTRMARLVS